MHPRSSFWATCLLTAGAGLLALPSVRANDSKRKGPNPPQGAAVLFDGQDLSGWVRRDGKPALWKVRDGYMEVVSVR
jgi:hypothetical protein